MNKLLDETDNPFRPEGSLAKEADEFIKELKTKTEKEINELIKNASSLNNSASLSVSELIHQTTNESEPVSQPNLNETSLDSNVNAPSSPVKQQQEKVPESPRVETAKSTPTVVVQADQTQQPLLPKNENDNSPTKRDDQAKPQAKKTKAKCGCVLS